jgi:hypothetical protein
MRTEAIVNRKLASFRLNENLLASLKIAAKRENRSVNNFVESALMQIVYRKSNKVTLAAIKESMEDKNMTTLDMTNIETFLKSLE